MKFQVNRDVLSEAVSFAVKLLSQRPTLPILGGVLIEAAADTLTLSTFDYEVSSKTEITAVVEGSGTALVHGRLLAEIAGRLPDAPVSVSTDDGKVLISCGSARFTLLSMPVEEYPTIPETGAVSGVVPATEFAEAVSQVAVAASRDDVTPVITGVQLNVTNTAMCLIATDRYRVAIRNIEWDGQADEVSALVPARTLQEIGKTFGSGGTIEVSLTSREDRELIAFRSEKRTVTSLLIKGNYPPVGRLFPELIDHYAVLTTSDLVEATRRVALVLEREAALRFSFTQDGLTLEAVGGDQAQASETIDVVLHGADMVVSLKPQFLLDGLASVHSEFVRLGFTATDNPNKPGPVLITAQTSRDAESTDVFRYLLQPNLLLR